jgi:parallel beta-helix repeat protein
MKMKLPTLRTIVLAFVICPSPFILAQGSLTPPGAPAPTMKTLAQIEPRIDLQNAPAAAVTTTDPNFHYIITQPGSYYLSANLAATKPNGIQINAEGVTLDLNGFEISRASGTGGNGIEIPATAHRASVRNGSLKGFASGIRSLLAGDYARGCGFRDLGVSGCTAYGILAGTGAVLESCRAHDNSGVAGIFAFTGSSLAHCTASGNTGSYGIFAFTGSSLAHCTASGNTGTYGIYAYLGSSLAHCAASGNTGTYGIFADIGSSLAHCTATVNTGTYGIWAGAGSSLTNCSAYRNTSAAAAIGTSEGATVTGCSAYLTLGTSTPTTGMGFVIGTACTIQNCTAYGSKGDGINVPGGCLVRDNVCHANGISGDGAGIHAMSSDNRIDANNVTGNNRGIDVSGAGNIIIRNTASGNTTNYEIVANNKVGPIVAAPDSIVISGDTGGAGVGSNNPWANFSF